ncbi:MAG: diguanylate cyclase (GGDEF)-like protein [Sulfurimonas sp.]|jgi:diguanylate cyclase (GGDEF)-like protein|uniref:bifunctional diguanylate cyclase/phosphodiesterase n=1 Tax=Sulfurimonas sp. TaxID=2022749 RepID=UPI0039E23A43
MIIKNNIWKLFCLIFFGGLSLLISLLYVSFNDINIRYHTQIKHYTEILSGSVNADFLQKDMILDIVGKQLFHDDSYKDTKKTEHILDDLLKQNPNLVSFGLADVNGNILISNSKVNINNKKNLLTDEVTNYDFKSSLTSKNMVVARTYYFQGIQKWIIPLRKAIRDENGKILGVVIAGIKNNRNSSYLDTFTLSKNKTVVITKDFDKSNKVYRQYYSNFENISNEDIYNIPISDESTMSVGKELQKKYNYSFEELRTNEKTLSVEAIDSFGKQMIAGITYDEKYKLWILVQGNKLDIWHEFYSILVVYTAPFVVIFILIFILSKNIATNEQRKNKELIFQAQHDSLTNLPNRIYMYENISTWKSRHKDKYHVLYLDLDNFKNINDKFGHTVGDKILVEVAQRLKGFFSKDDMLIRQGGDEFIVLMDEVDEIYVEKQMNNLITIISKIYHIDTKEFRIGMSVGASQYPADASDIEELLSLADTAMYEAKKRKNSYCLFSEKMRSYRAIKTDIEHELRGAIEQDELWMVYQPQINAKGSLCGVEALIRWENIKLGNIGPDKFISVAEETGLMKELGEFILITSLRDIKSIQSLQGISFNLSINISVVQLVESDFLENFLEIVESEKFDKSYLTLEITESLSIEDLDEVLPLLHAIRKEGIKLSLDDFGTGYSSLSILRDLPINELKIDKSFIDNILYDDSEKALVQTIINMGKTFNMKTLAEGVESLGQVEELKKVGCDIFQGYYYSKPLSKEQLVDFLTHDSFK